MSISKTQINKIGEKSRECKLSIEDIKTIEVWRASHWEPALAIREKLYNEINKKIDCHVVARLKRMETIIDKLKRLPELSLSKMQDVGGVRVILEDFSNLYQVVDICKATMSNYKLYRENDYIVKPKKDGYRGVHLVYDVDGCYVEIQIRTKIEHIWATSVETVGMMTKEKLKSDQGSEKWMEFFVLLSKLIEASEKTYSATGDDLENYGRKVINCVDVFSNYAKEIRAVELLKSYGNGFRQIDEKLEKIKDEDYYIIAVGYNNVVSIFGFNKKNKDDAVNKYNSLEQSGKYIDKVLVSVDDYKKLKVVYPNYFAETSALTEFVSGMINIAEKHTK